LRAATASVSISGFAATTCTDFSASGWPIVSIACLDRRADFRVGRVSGLDADLRGSAVRRRQVAGHAAALRRAEHNEVPAIALWLSNIVVSLFIISTYRSRDAFNFMLNMTSVTTLLPGPLSTPWRSCAGSTV